MDYSDEVSPSKQQKKSHVTANKPGETPREENADTDAHLGVIFKSS